MTAQTTAERKAAERQRHKEAGRVPVTVYVRPEWREEIRALEAKLQRRETRSANRQRTYADDAAMMRNKPAAKQRQS